MKELGLIPMLGPIIETRVIATSEVPGIKRSEESLGSRLLAAEILKSLNSSETNVARGSHNQPIWPEGFSGSISHCRINSNESLIGVAVHKSEVGQPQALVGLDLESESRIEQTIRVRRMIMTTKEAEIAESLESLDTLITFSAKEALYKALFPVIKRAFWFDSAELVAIEGNMLRFIPQKLLKEAGIRNLPLVLWKRIEPDCISTVVYEEQKNLYSSTL